MKLVEDANAGAVGSLVLAEGVKQSLWKLIEKLSHGLETLVVVPRVTPSSKPSGTALLNDAWMGTLRRTNSSARFEMITPAGLWYSDKQTGRTFLADTTLAPDTLAGHLAMLAPQGFVNATAEDHAGNWGGDVRAGISYRNAWAAIAAAKGLAWRIDRQGRPVWGDEADVFAEPTALILDRTSRPGKVGTLRVIPGGPNGFDSDSSQVSKGVVSIGPDDAGVGRIKVADPGPDVGFFPNGAAVNPYRVLNLAGVADETTRTNLTAAAAGRYNVDALPRVAFQIRANGGDRYPMLARIAAGDRIFVHSSRFNQTDPTEDVINAPGGPVRPRRFQVRRIDWDAHAGAVPIIYRPNDPEPWAYWDLLIDRVETGDGTASIDVDSDLTPYQDATDIGIPEAPATPSRTVPRTGTISSSTGLISNRTDRGSIR